jgi:hypothetical protein
MKPAIWDDLLQGIRVRCIYTGSQSKYGKLATIMKADRHSYPGIIVSWDGNDNSGDGLNLWSYPGSFEVIEEQK